MKKYFFIVLLLSVTNIFGQDSGWSEPKKIHEIGNVSAIDYTVDANNVIHCVWRKYYDRWFRKIFYSKSEDMGETWSEPFDLSMNTGHWADHPKICSDSKNNIYVIYAYLIGEVSPSQLIFKKFDGEKWSEPVDIAKETPNSSYPCLAIDNNDRVYAFWHIWNNHWYKIYYRYLEDTVWSPIFKPFEDDYDFYIRKAIPDEQNNIHCVGQFKKDSEERYGFRAVYFTYDNKKETWGVNKVLSDTTSLLSIDIDLDSEERPHIVWSQFFQDTIPPPEASFYSFNDGSNWSTPQQIGIADADDETPVIALDEYDNTHIIQRKYYHHYPRYTTLTYYNNLNKCERIDSLQYLGGQILQCQNSTLILIYGREMDDGLYYEFFRKKSLTSTGIGSKEQIKSDFRLFGNYPNPFNNSTKIQFSLKENKNVNITIYDISGAKIKTLVNEIRPPGLNSVVWNGTGSNGLLISSGVYFYRLITGGYSETRKMVFLQ